MAGRPRTIKDNKELEEKINKYKQYLNETGRPPTIAGLAYHIGCNRQTLYNYYNDSEYFDTLKNFYDWILQTYEETVISAKNPAGLIFLLKNYGYTDRQDISQTVADVTDKMTDQERQDRIKELISKTKLKAVE